MRNVKVIAVVLTAAAVCSAAEHGSGWDAARTARYLDGQIQIWLEKVTAAKNSRVSCVSCHTSLTYLMARPALRAAGAPDPAANYESTLYDALKRRVAEWHASPYYPSRAAQSRGSEAVLFALLLARQDAQAGRERPSEETESAFRNLWSEQVASGPLPGTWGWLRFDLDPWEGRDSDYWGAGMAAVAVGSAPGNYRQRPEIQSSLARLIDYLRGGREGRTLHARLPVLWASARLPQALPEADRAQVLAQLRSRQNADGGWSVAALGPWAPKKDVTLTSESDAYATAFTAFALQESGFSEAKGELARAVAWLKTHQDAASGAWKSLSMNKVRGPNDQALHFMTDAATGYAAMVLCQDRRR